jgi:hypothetical protein
VDGDGLERGRVARSVSSARLTKLPPFPDRLVIDRRRSRTPGVVLESRVTAVFVRLGQ